MSFDRSIPTFRFQFTFFLSPLWLESSSQKWRIVKFGSLLLTSLNNFLHFFHRNLRCLKSPTSPQLQNGRGECTHTFHDCLIVTLSYYLPLHFHSTIYNWYAFFQCKVYKSSFNLELIVNPPHPLLDYCPELNYD